MQHLDEGTIHAWLDGELSSPEREAAEAHVAECAQCAAAVAEARGFIAASTRILTALDSVPGGVLPAKDSPAVTTKARGPRRFAMSRAWMAAAAVLVLSTVTVIARRPGGEDTLAKLERAPGAQDRIAPVRAAPVAPPAEEREESADSSRARAEKEQKDVRAFAKQNAPTSVADSRADEPKSVDQTERLKSRLEAERQSTRVRSSNGAPSAMAGAAPPARVPEQPAPMARMSEQPATPPAPAAFAKDAAEKRADAVSKSDLTSERRKAANAQGVSITGRVTSDAGMPIASASIELEGTGIGTTTRDDGSYALLVPASRANGQTTSLVARLIGWQAAAVPIAPDSEPITLDFRLRSNPVALNQLVVTGAGTTSTSDKLGAVTALDSATADSAAPRLLSRNTIHIGGDTVVTAIYSVRGVSVSLIDHSRARDEAGRLQLRGAVNEMSAKSRAAAAAVNSISWSDSTGHTRTLRGPLTTEQLTQLKNTLFAPTP